MNDGLKDTQRNAILEVLNKHPKIERAVLFGSRAMGSFTRTSDIDIALYGDLSLRDQARIADELAQLSIPYTVDLVRMKTVNSPELIEHIKKHGSPWLANAASADTRSAKKGEGRVMAGDPVRMCPTVEALPDGWQVKRLGSFCVKIGTGATPRGGSEVYLPNRIKHALIRSQNVLDRKFDSVGIAYISADHANELRNADVISGDILLNITGDGVTFGRSCIVPEGILPACVNQHVSIIRPDRRECDPDYLLSVLTHPMSKGYIESFNAGGSRRAITKGHIESFQIPLPPLKLQKSIGVVLRLLDDMIEVNREINETLEEIARALFKSWFLDFDPVRAKLEGRPPAGMDAGTAALFPDHFQDSELGQIPRGWEAKPLPKVIDVNPRRTLRSGTIAPYLDMKNLPTQGHCALDVIDREFSSGTKFQNGDTLLARITPCLENGKTGYVDFLEEGQVGWGSTEYIVLSPKAPLPPQFGYFLARSDALRVHAIQNMIGTSGRQRVPAECLNSFLIVMPSPVVAQRFNEMTAPLMEQIKANTLESRDLATLRDTLLPKLLSGELPITVG